MSPHVQVTERAEKGVDRWYGTSLKVLLSQGREGICWGMLVPTMVVLGPSRCAKCHCLMQRLPGRWEASTRPNWYMGWLAFQVSLHCLLPLQS